MKNKITLLWILIGVFTFGLFFGGSLIPRLLEKMEIAGPRDESFTLAFAIALVVAMILQGILHRKEWRLNNLSYGSRSTTTVIMVISIVALLNVLAFKRPNSWDLTPEKLHTLSHHSTKVLQGLDKEVKFEVYGKLAHHEQHRPLLNNYRNASSHVKLEFIDVDKEVTRTKLAEITRPAVRVVVGDRSQKIETIDEGTLTNAMISLIQNTVQELCYITGHGEGNLEDKEAEGFSSLKENLENRAYKITVLDLPQSETGIPANCKAIIIMGASQSFFDKEIKALEDYLTQGGRAVIAMGHDLSREQYSDKLNVALKAFGLQFGPQLIVDPLSTRTNIADPAVPMLLEFNKAHELSKDLDDKIVFVWARPIEISSDIAASKPEWLAKSTPFSFGESGIKELVRAQGQRKIVKDAGEPAGPLVGAAAVKATLTGNTSGKESRLVVFGSSRFANNSFRRFGQNADFFSNAVSWVVGDESQVAIEKKSSEEGRIELSVRARRDIRNLTVFAFPGLIAFFGIFNWRRRKKL